MSDFEMSGLVRVVKNELLEMIASKKLRLKSVTDKAHEERIQAIIEHSSRRRYILRPWRLKPPMSWERANAIYREDDPMFGWSDFDRYDQNYRNSMVRMKRLESSVETVDHAYLTVETISWLKGVGPNDA